VENISNLTNIKKYKQKAENDLYFTLPMSNFYCQLNTQNSDLKPDNISYSKLHTVVVFLSDLSKFKQIYLDIVFDGNIANLYTLLSIIKKYNLFHIHLNILCADTKIDVRMLDMFDYFNITTSVILPTTLEKNYLHKTIAFILNHGRKCNIIINIDSLNYKFLYPNFKYLSKKCEGHLKNLYYNLNTTDSIIDFDSLTKQFEKIYRYILKKKISVNFEPLVSILGFKLKTKSLPKNSFYIENVNTITEKSYYLENFSEYKKLLFKLGDKLVTESLSNANYFIGDKFELISEKYYFPSPISNIGAELGVITCNDLDAKDSYLCKSFMTKKNNKLYCTSNNFIQVTHNIAAPLVPMFFDEPPGKTYKIETKSYIYYLYDQVIYSNTAEHYLNKLKNNTECFYRLKFETNYLFNKLDFLLEFPNKTTNYYKTVLSTYVNLHLRVLLFKSLLWDLDDSLSKEQFVFNIARWKYNLFYSLDLEKFKTKRLYYDVPLPQNFNLGKIIFERKKRLKQDVGLYFKYDLIDTSFFFVDSFHGIINKLLMVFQTLGYPDSKDLFKVDYQHINIKTTMLSDFVYYGSIGYKNGLFDKKEYLSLVQAYIRKKEITVKEVIEYYPLISPYLLEK